MRRKLLSVLLTVIAFVMASPCSKALAQDDNPSMQYLRTTYPRLTRLFGEELQRYHAHYVFAVDVSGTMNRFEPQVLGALRPFFQALPDGDRVDVIPFGGTQDPARAAALPNMPQYSGIINGNVKQSLVNSLGQFYNDPNYPEGFKACTYVNAAVDAVTNSLSNNRGYKVNIVVLVTDFRNENPEERQFTDDELQQMHDAFVAATNDIYTRTIALELPIDHNVRGYCLPQLHDKVFDSSERGLEIVPMGTSGDQIGTWFDDLKREIMVDKLRAVIENANKLNPARLIVKTDIDGNINAEIHWTPSRLYPKMKIDSTYVGQEGFFFVNNKKAFTETRDSVIGADREDCNVKELYLGKLKNDAYFFHHFNDSLHLGIDLPTEYDNELLALNVKKPIPETTRAENKWIFTFFLPFWLTATIVALIILYLIFVFRTWKKNRNLSLEASVAISDAAHKPVGRTRMINLTGNASLTIGQGGDQNCNVTGVKWQMRLYKVVPSAFTLKSAYYQWEKTQDFIIGDDTYDKFDGQARLAFGPSYKEKSHFVNITQL